MTLPVAAGPLFTLDVTPRRLATPFRAAPRTLLLLDFLAYIAAEHRAGHAPIPDLPDAPITVSLAARTLVLPSKGWRGRFCLGREHAPEPGWRVEVAYGGPYRQPMQVELDILATVAHELGHLATWARLSGGRAPGAVPPGDITWRAFADLQGPREEARIEEEAVELVCWSSYSPHGRPGFADPALLLGASSLITRAS